MANKIEVASLKEFNPAHYLNDSEAIKAYIQVVEEEKNVDAFSGALQTVFLAIGANAVAKELGIATEQVWDVQERPSEHLGNLHKIKELMKDGLSILTTPNPHMGSNFEDFLKEEGIHDEVTALAIRRVIAALSTKE
jgi:DNA-binding phage protein